MLRNKLKPNYALALAAVILLCAVIVYMGKLPEAVTVFKERIEADKAARQFFQSFDVMDNTFHFELPDSWSTQEVTFNGGEILYHLNFISQDRRIHGFVQVWKLSEPLKQFVEKSKESAVGIIDFKHFDIREIMSDSHKGYLLDYSRANSKGEYIRAYEAFIEGFSNNVYRLSFFVPEREWKNYYKVIFDRIIHTIKIKN